MPEVGDGAVLAGRSARRHQGVPLRQRRVHGQHRPDRRAAGRSSAWCWRRRAGSPGGEPRARAPSGARTATVTRHPRPPRPASGAVAVASRSHRDAETDAWLAEPRASPTPSRPAARSSSAWSPRARPTSIRASGRPWSGTRRPGDAVLRAAGGRVEDQRRARRSSTSSPASATRASSPGAPEPASGPRRHGSSRLGVAACCICCRRRRRTGPRSGCCPGCRPRRLPGPAAPAHVRWPGSTCRTRSAWRPASTRTREASAALLRQGFAFVEIGTVTPRPQAGNPRPRLFRLAADRAIINRMGFNNDGARGRGATGSPAAIAAGRGRRQYRHEQGRRRPGRRLRSRAARRFAPLADYVTVNVSSPNTPGLRALQQRDALARLLGGRWRPVARREAPVPQDRARPRRRRTRRASPSLPRPRHRRADRRQHDASRARDAALAARRARRAA